MPRYSTHKSKTPAQQLPQPPDSHSASLIPSHGSPDSSGAASGAASVADVLNQQLDIDEVCRACTSLRTQAAHPSYRRGIATWIR
ncbi:hypothetical protein L916_20868 [Phytophthora nicotianae]|uniref:Uncharacterized protein n=1 Tax=Phytophthora nicotianae TaxID=4792 RepID=W2HVT3_PHYNI|nr:hypothetical protein L916_20868 [Phytophthora nicotianae]